MNLLDLFENTNQPQGVAEGVDVFYNAGETANKKPVGKGTKVKSKITGKVGKAHSWSVVKGVPYLHVKSDNDIYQSPAKDWLVLDEQGVSEGHADQQRTIVKRNGQPVGEVGIDRESSPGVGQYYMKHYASGTDLSGYDSREEAMDELRYAVKQGVAEAMKPSDISPGMRQRLTMRDIEAERPQGAFRFRVITPQGDQIDFMDQSAADARARAVGGRVEPIDAQPQGLTGQQSFRVRDTTGNRPSATFRDRSSAERYATAKNLPIEPIPETDNRKPGARIERILKMLRARHPQAENDLEALIFDFRGQQAQDRSDIARLDSENDMEEADIQRLEKMLDLVRRRRGATAAEPAMATEGLRDGEYHVAKVTLDDGTVKQIKITSDEGFRDRIMQHFAKQGREVRDIDVDSAVRSDLDETKKKPQPTNPDLWSRAKAAARSKFDVYPSAYANAWAAKWYKSKGGGWRMGKPKKD